VNDREYDELWRTSWGDMQRVGPVHRHIQDDLLKMVRGFQVKTILDVGCGSGENLAALARSGDYALTGTDLSPEALSITQRRVPGARLVALDVQQDRVPGAFDLVMSIQVVEHLPDDRAAIANMAMMSDRYVFISTMAGRMRPSERHIGHVRNYSPAELRQKMEDAGLAVQWIRGWGFPFYSPLYRTIAEWLPGGPPAGTISRPQRLVADALYELYRLNVPGRGDVLSALGTVSP
jgi:2-polyprenyl-3-methyl-5-hydroxy-6-metoxy-1,4-benzoquinol methylase